MLSTSCATDPHLSPTTSASDLPSSAARSLARRSALSLHEAPPSPTPPLLPALSSAAPGASFGRSASASSVGFPSPPSFQKGFSSRSAATLACLSNSASRLCCAEDFGSRAFDASSARARSRPPPIQSSRPPSGCCDCRDGCPSGTDVGSGGPSGPLGPRSSSLSEPEESEDSAASLPRLSFFSFFLAFLASFLARFFSFLRSRSTSSLATILTPPRRPMFSSVTSLPCPRAALGTLRNFGQPLFVVARSPSSCRTKGIFDFTRFCALVVGAREVARAARASRRGRDPRVGRPSRISLAVLSTFGGPGGPGAWVNEVEINSRRYLSRRKFHKRPDSKDGRVREAHGGYPGSRVEHRVRALQGHEEASQTARETDDH